MVNDSRQMSLRKALELRYPRQSEREVAFREQIISVCQSHIYKGLGDNDAEKRLCSDDNAKYWQQLSEVLLAHQLSKLKIQLKHSIQGPDFLIEFNGQRIWIEVICPEPAGIPYEWTNHVTGTVCSVPHEAILLRWTAAIKEKAEKLLGSAQKNSMGYLAKNIVAPADAYVIAVNGRLLRGLGPELYGISQFPYAVEATFCVGPLQVHLNRETLATVGSDHQYRPLIDKPKGRPVPVDTFLDPNFAPVSAIWAVDIDETSLINNASQMIVVHNPNASNPISKNFLPAWSEFVSRVDSDEYIVDRFDGRFVIDEQ